MAAHPRSASSTFPQIAEKGRVMSREFPFDEKLECQVCGELGAFDLMGSYICQECLGDGVGPEDWEPSEAQQCLIPIPAAYAEQ